MSDFNQIKDLYEDGFRCIYFDSNNNNHTIYLKNFDSEKSQVVELENDNDFNQFQDYINTLRME